MSLGDRRPAICSVEQSIDYSGVSPDSNLRKWNSSSPSDNHDLCLSWKITADNSAELYLLLLKHLDICDTRYSLGCDRNDNFVSSVTNGF